MSRTVVAKAPSPPRFLTADMIPPNLKGLHVGDKVKIEVPDKVLRVGYRLHPAELVATDIRRLLESEAGLKFRRSYFDLFGKAPSEKAEFAFAYDYVAAAKFGGPERGILVQSHESVADGCYTVCGLKTVQVGTRYPGYSQYDSFTGEYDSDCGGLEKRRPIILVDVGFEDYYMSGCLSKMTEQSQSSTS